MSKIGIKSQRPVILNSEDKEEYGLSAHNIDLRHLQEMSGERIELTKIKSDNEISNDLDAILFYDLKDNFNSLNSILESKYNIKLYLVQREPAIVDENCSVKNIERYIPLFDKIFSWNDTLCRNHEDIINYTWPVPKKSSELTREFQNQKLLVNISTNLQSSHPDELYTERKKVIEYYDKNHPDKFTLYGGSWNESPHFVSSKNLEDSIRRFKHKIFANNNYSVWEGRSEKIEPYSNHKFALCFENMAGSKGYITEKIIDCFRYGVVPIYWGATNIDNYVPEGSYIDYREIGDPKELHRKISSMEKEEYMKMLREGERFNSERVSFTSEKYCKKIWENLEIEEKSGESLDTPQSLKSEIELKSDIYYMLKNKKELSLREYIKTYRRVASKKPEKLLNPVLTLNIFRKLI